MKRVLPGTLKTVRVLLFVVAAFYGVVALAGFWLAGVSGVSVAYVLWATWPGIFHLAFGLRLPRGGRPLLWSIVALEVVSVLMALSNLLAGDAEGLVQLILPVVILVLTLRRPSREFFRERSLARH